jgi:hypothetical protein
MRCARGRNESMLPLRCAHAPPARVILQSGPLGVFFRAPWTNRSEEGGGRERWRIFSSSTLIGTRSGPPPRHGLCPSRKAQRDVSGKQEGKQGSGLFSLELTSIGYKKATAPLVKEAGSWS